MTTLTGAGTYKRQRYLSTGKTALKTIEKRQASKCRCNDLNISDTIVRKVFVENFVNIFIEIEIKIEKGGPG